MGCIDGPCDVGQDDAKGGNWAGRPNPNPNPLMFIQLEHQVRGSLACLTNLTQIRDRRRRALARSDLLFSLLRLRLLSGESASIMIFLQHNPHILVARTRCRYFVVLELLRLSSSHHQPNSLVHFPPYPLRRPGQLGSSAAGKNDLQIVGN